MKKEPRNIEEALNYAIKLEAFEQSLLVTNSGDDSVDTDDSRTKKRPKYVYSVADPPASQTAALQRQVTELQQALAQATKGITAMASAPWEPPVQVSAATPTGSTASQPIVPRSTSDPASKSAPPAGAWTRGSGRGRGAGRQNRQNDPCRLCGQVGHWANECPTRHRDPSVKGVTCQYASPTKVYVKAEFRGQPIKCLLDSGCERSVIGRKCIPGVRLRKSSYTLSAANRTNLPIDGDADIHFVFDGLPVYASVSVSPAIDELLLGSDWLVENRCR